MKNTICVPLLVDRIYDSVYLEAKSSRLIKDLVFEIKEKESVNYGENEICIEDIYVDYCFIGLTNNENAKMLTSYVNNKEINFVQDECSSEFECGGPALYNTYKNKDNIKITSSDSKEDKSCRITQIGVEFYVCNLVITLTGKIGCEDFEARTRYSGPILDIMEFQTTPIDFIGDICLPSEDICVNMRLKFDGCIEVDCVSTQVKFDPNPHTNPYQQFKADILSYLLVTEKIDVIVKEKVVAYVRKDSF